MASFLSDFRKLVLILKGPIGFVPKNFFTGLLLPEPVLSTDPTFGSASSPAFEPSRWSRIRRCVP